MSAGVLTSYVDFFFQNRISDANVSMYADDHQVFVAKETTKSVDKILVDNGETG